eukprot:scaffold92004_cov21-Tisochrysis_lutea.AAC.1
MSQRGYNVDVFEQRQPPKSSDARSHRSYPMVLSSRSAQGFKEAGLQLPLPEPQAAIFMPNGKLEMLWEDSEALNFLRPAVKHDLTPHCLITCATNKFSTQLLCTIVPCSYCKQYIVDR